MTKNIFFSFLLALTLFGSANAQVGMNVPNGSFEQWTNHPGYSINVVYLDVPLYDSFPTPSGWGYLAYPVNETISLGFANLNINTDVPLVLASQDTGAVPDGNSAVKLQTFMLGDIIDPDIVTLAADYLDSSLTNSVIPSILTMGEVNVGNLVPIITDMMSNGGGLLSDSIDLMSLLDSIADVDINHFITGGIPVASYMPSRLTGSYRYHSADSGDNGGVLLIGTRYNATLGKRQLVGGGVNIALTDCADYTSFEAEYVSLNSINANINYQEPDSLIIVLVSSASLNRQQGSYLCVDNLMLWLDTASIAQPDECADIVGLSVAPGIHEAEVGWNADGEVEGFEIEYGPAGFEHGNGTSVLTVDNNYTIQNLVPGSQYDVYVRTVCSDEIYGEWAWEHFITNPDTCARILSIAMDSSNIVFVSDQQLTGYKASWQSSFDSEAWEIEYGSVGFEPGTGISDQVESPFCTLGTLQADSQYELRVRSVCSSHVYGDWKSIQFHTAKHQPGVAIGNDNLSAHGSQPSIYPNPANGRCVVSFLEDMEVHVSVYSLDGSLLQHLVSDSSSVTIDLPSQGVFLLKVVTPQGTYLRKVVNK